jgi:hypothetical protein
MALYIIESDLDRTDLRDIFAMGDDGCLYEMRTSANSSENYGNIRFVMQPFGVEILDEIKDEDYDKIKNEILEA